MLAVFTTLALALTDPTGSAELTRVLYPLSGVLGPRSPATVEVWPVPIEDWHARGLDTPDITANARRVVSDRVADLVRVVVAPKEWEQPGRVAELVLVSDSTYLAITAPVEVQAEVRNLLTFLASHLRREIRVRCEAFSLLESTPELEALARDADPRARIDALAASGTLRPVGRTLLTLLPGVPAQADRLRERAFLSDFDVEIAQRSAVFDPIVRTCALGLALAARADIAPDGAGVVLHFAARYADDLRPARQIDATSRIRIAGEGNVSVLPADSGLVESPNVAFQTLAGAANLRPGVARVAFAAPLGADADDVRGLVLAFTLESLAPADPTFTGAERELAVRDVGVGWGAAGAHFGEIEPRGAGLTRSILDSEPRTDGLATGLRIDAAAMPGEGSPPTPIELELAAASMTGQAEGVTLDHERGFLFAVATQSHARAIVDRIAAALPAPIATTFVAFASAPGSARRDAVFCIPAARGDAFVACGFVETLLFDNDVDVAEGSSIADPKVRPVFTGRFARLTASADSSGESILDLSLIARARVAESAGIAAGYGQAPRLDRPTQSATAWSEPLRFTRQRNTASIEQALPRASGAPEYLDLDVERIER